MKKMLPITEIKNDKKLSITFNSCDFSRHLLFLIMFHDFLFFQVKKN